MQLRYEVEQLRSANKAKSELEAALREANHKLHKQRVEYEQTLVSTQESMRKEEEGRSSDAKFTPLRVNVAWLRRCESVERLMMLDFSR